MVSVRTIRDLELGHARYPRRQTVGLLADALRLDGERRARFAGAATADGAAPAVPGGYLGAAAQMPRPSGPLIGRQRTVQAVTDLFDSRHERWVSIVGIAGVGKTRLAQAIASTAYVHGSRSVLWVSAERPAGRSAERPAGRPADPPGGRLARRHRISRSQLSATAAELLSKGERAVEDLAALIEDWPVLLVVDGHDATRIPASSLFQLLRRCPNVNVVTTSRQPEPETGDCRLVLSPLDIPEDINGRDTQGLATYPAVALLLSNLRLLRPDVPLTDAQTVAAAHVSRALDGIPLALRAAASWLPLYRSDELMDLALHSPLTLTESVSDRSAGDGAGLRASLSATVASLPPRHRWLIRTLSQWREPWSVENAAEVTGHTRDQAATAVHELLERGLVRSARSADGEFGRFRVLNLVGHLAVAAA